MTGEKITWQIFRAGRWGWLLLAMLTAGLCRSGAQSFVPVYPADRADNVGLNSLLKASPSVPGGGNVTLTFYGRRTGQNRAPGFTVVALPDTQYYVSVKSNGVPEMFYAQTDWIVTNRAAQNIVYVAQLGDCVESGDLKGGGNNLTEWRNATNALYRLENPLTTLLTEGIPYGVAVGNHDQEPNGNPNGTTTYYNQFFGISHFAGRDYYGGHYSTNNDNHFDTFRAGGMDFVAVYMEYDTNANPAVLAWADNVLRTHPEHRAIIITHYLGNAATPSTFSPQGAAIYTALKTNANLFLMLAGHVNGEGSRADVFEGRTVRTLISDYQFRTNGGNGFLRRMVFSPRSNLVSVTSYSPWTDKFETDTNSQFTFPYDMAPATNDYTVIGVVSNAPSGGVANVPWPGREPDADYEWFVTATKGSLTYTGMVWNLTTSVSNAPPTVTNQIFTVGMDGSANRTLAATDADADVLAFQAESLPTHGTLPNFNGATGVFTYRPAHGFSGTDAFQFRVRDGQGTGTLATATLQVQPLADGNANGLPDAWEAAYGVSNPLADPDGDGLNNAAEYLANTNPTNAASGLRLLPVRRQPGGAVEVIWGSVGGVRYRVQYANRLNGNAAPNFTDIIQPAAVEMDPASLNAPSTRSFLDDFSQTGLPTNGSRYYRVKVLP